MYSAQPNTTTQENLDRFSAPRKLLRQSRGKLFTVFLGPEKSEDFSRVSLEVPADFAAVAEQKKVYAKGNEQVAVVQPEDATVATPAPKAPSTKLDSWRPKTELGKKVKSKEITDINNILENGYKIKEPEIADMLIPDILVEYILIGQAHGKFGGGKRRLIRQTQKKTAEGNKPHFSAFCIVGNQKGVVGFGSGKALESLPAKEKALKQAKLNLMKLPLGCGSWKCNCGEPHSLPFAVHGKCGAVEVKLMPAPKGAGLVVEDEIKKFMKAAGYKDLWSKTWGQTRKKVNFVYACASALQRAASAKRQ